MSGRVYLDWNATTPLRPEARAAMIEAMDLVGNPSSVHAEGRAAKGLLERARAGIAEAFGAEPDEVVLTSGATEAAALALRGRNRVGAPVEHDCVLGWIDACLPVTAEGRVEVAEPGRTALQAANSETGIVQELPPGLALVDAAQVAGKLPFAFGWTGARAALIAPHKFGGPKGIGALLLRRGEEVEPLQRGGGQELGRRAGTENLIGAAGFAAAARAAVADLARGIWEEVAETRNILERALEDGNSETIFVGKGSARLPNTLALVTPGWKGETQVMAMDLAGFAVSAGSACSSGKVKASRTLTAMGYEPEVAAAMLRVSIGPGVEREAVLAFADAWKKSHSRARRRRMSETSPERVVGEV
ncbi:cysteine desulfurase family protein [Amaricoccus solimangrovi]|uniref:Cysteine desulfurase n=1 Tax=Amaricoccus solimangrovi TaxID=2589815 RepID=A0A501WZE7_9RHOB|nr:aminotransferase class V-fold PLP-dependent enzyme [Amaricoccus solimangrovi]TPE53814.1 aminotransferase class V-fold PLP-dependent enzyme [Amaricoccus solimangrovi]